MKHLLTYSNAELGIESRILLAEDGRYHVVMRDTDADRTVSVQICIDLPQAERYARVFVTCDGRETFTVEHHQ